MSVEAKVTELLVRRAQPGGERVLDWLVYGTPLPRLPRLDVMCCDQRDWPGLGGDGLDNH
ncbi:MULTISPECIES: hypothetical protein [Mycobacteriaceae]|uniref:Uncharacterized protein n=2 Tax=Mycobacterium avium complex (MAC) TaxID=120793 RepID=A0A220YKV0_MYCIT|nr:MULTISPECIES: hypothetical protein [Mycobacteriaceae]PJE18827.1 MAG: hypothetical protein CK429_02345 [Mycobacterium sp.]AOS95141.1 hypothetical protein AN480_29280 [Mycobacterium intracellulare subsp. chimaera]ASL18473.1 hypothetical protein MYCOZU2_06128 [Mycobacterium intracellulare subsp. chimaera]ASL24345.1 hypothetical protein MYCOZU1_05985 [Mycobacterium intracellulare subsp. chimaera]ASQ89521.1 hypothetical protein CE197_27695 [Mycobacterium intracellulare subsp. chimaera]